MRILLEYNGKPLPRKMLISGQVDHPERNVIAYIDGSAYPFLTENPFYERVVELFSMAEEIGHPDNDSVADSDLPTLPDYIKEHGWPDWAKYAMVRDSGAGMWFNQIVVLNNGVFDTTSWKGRSAYIGCFTFDTTNWQNSLVEKCPNCDGKGKIMFSTCNENINRFCVACKGTKIKPQQDIALLRYAKGNGLVGELQFVEIDEQSKQTIERWRNRGKNPDNEPKLKSLADEPWPDPNEGRSSRKVEDGNLKYYNQFLQEWHLTDTGYENADQEKHPRYNDILWLRKWKGKRIVSSSYKEWYEVLSLVIDQHHFANAKRADGKLCTIPMDTDAEFNWNWQEYKEPKRVPLTAKDFLNIKGIRSNGWSEGRMDIITAIGEITVKCGNTSASFAELASRNELEGITFDNRIVPLYKEER